MDPSPMTPMGARIVDVDGYPLEEAWGRHAVLAFPAGLDPATTPAPHGVEVLPATDGRSGRDALIRHAADHPEDYLADTDAVRVELWMRPDGWNEGFEATFNPMLTYFVAATDDLSPLRPAVAALAGHLPWTSFELRTSPGSSRALRYPVTRVVDEVVEFITTQADRYVP